MSKYTSLNIFSSESQETQIPLSTNERRSLQAKHEEIEQNLNNPGPGVLAPTVIGGLLGLATITLAVGESQFGGGINPGGTAAVLGTEVAIVVLPWVGRALCNISRKNSVRELGEALEFGRRPARPFHGLPAVDISAELA